MEEQKQKQNRLSRTQKLWLIALILMMMSLSGCATSPHVSAPKISPTAEFVECVSDEYVHEAYGKCTKEVVKDWSTMIQ